MQMRRTILVELALGVLLLAGMGLGGCAFGAGAAAGAGAAGAGYEYKNKQALDELDDDYAEGKISREEYLRRKREIDEHSIVY
jgi:hypothetical protein